MPARPAMLAKTMPGPPRRMDKWYSERNGANVGRSPTPSPGLRTAIKVRRRLCARSSVTRTRPRLSEAALSPAMSGIGGVDVTAAHSSGLQLMQIRFVRLGRGEAAGNIPPEQRMEAIGKLLGDGTRAVRVAAATALGGTPPDLFGSEKANFETAVADLRAYVDTNADVAEIQSNFGFFLFGQQQAAQAEAAFRRAILLDPTLEGSRVNLAEFYRATGQTDQSARTYAEAVSILPDRAKSALRTCSIPRSEEGGGLTAIEELEEAVRLDPQSSRYKTTLAVALDSLGRTEDALTRLGAWMAAGSDADVTGLALQYSLKLQRLPDALKFAEQMAPLRPQDQQIRDLLKQLRQAVNPQ